MTESKWWNSIHFKILIKAWVSANVAWLLWTWNTLMQTGGPLSHCAWRFSVSISRKQPLVWANAFSEVLPNSAWWNIEKSCAKWGAIAQDRASPPAAPRQIRSPIHPNHSQVRSPADAFHHQHLWQQPQGWKDACRRALSASSAAVCCLRLLWLSGVFLMHTDLCAEYLWSLQRFTSESICIYQSEF